MQRDCDPTLEINHRAYGQQNLRGREATCYEPRFFSSIGKVCIVREVSKLIKSLAGSPELDEEMARRNQCRRRSRQEAVRLCRDKHRILLTRHRCHYLVLTTKHLAAFSCCRITSQLSRMVSDGCFAENLAFRRSVDGWLRLIRPAVIHQLLICVMTNPLSVSSRIVVGTPSQTVSKSANTNPSCSTTSPFRTSMG
jgi:hypothetical protein